MARWWARTWLATRRSAVDRSTATMLYAGRDRSFSMRRWLPQNRRVRDGPPKGNAGENDGEGRSCCGGAPAGRALLAHGRRRSCSERNGLIGSVGSRHLGPAEPGELTGHGSGHDRLHVLAGGQGMKTR